MRENSLSETLKVRLTYLYCKKKNCSVVHSNDLVGPISLTVTTEIEEKKWYWQMLFGGYIPNLPLEKVITGNRKCYTMDCKGVFEKCVNENMFKSR